MDCLQGWPEPIVRVQSLSESGCHTIPDQYIKPPTDRPSSNTSSDCHISIPVVDLSADPEQAAKAVGSACRDWGFIQVVNHGVDPTLMKRTREAWRGFFHEPMEVKQRYANSPKTYEGYGSRVGIEKGALLDWGDYYFLHVCPNSLMNQEKWPALPSPLRPTTSEYTRELLKLCRRLMKLLSRGLGLDEGSLQEAFGGNDIGACIRVNFYSKCPQPDLTLGLSSHSDPGGMTVLLADDHVKGLQVRKDGAWVTVQPEPHAFIVNVGDQIQVLSNAVYKSVEHRVMVSATDERISMAFFYNPRSDLPLQPISKLVTSDRPALYQPMTFDEYRVYIRTKGLRGKSQVDSLKTVK